MKKSHRKKPSPPAKPKAQGSPAASNSKTRVYKHIEPTKELWVEICDRITAGESLRQVLESNLVKFPTLQTFFRWMDAAIDAKEGEPLYGLSDHYARSLLGRAAIQGDQVVEIADNPWTEEWRTKVTEALNAENSKLVAVYMRGMLQHAQMRIDARKWHSARMDPKRWHLNADSGKAAEVKDSDTVNIVGGLPDEDRTSA